MNLRRTLCACRSCFWSSMNLPHPLRRLVRIRTWKNGNSYIRVCVYLTVNSSGRLEDSDCNKLAVAKGPRGAESSGIRASLTKERSST